MSHVRKEREYEQADVPLREEVKVTKSENPAEHGAWVGAKDIGKDLNQSDSAIRRAQCRGLERG
jgi:hypothetical protein